jgi:alpha-2-macroglobulin
MRPIVKLILLLGTLVLLVSCPGRKKGAYVIDPDDTAPPTEADPEPGLVIRLGHAEAAAVERPPVEVAEAVALDEAAVTAVLARLPPLPTDPADARDFALREGSRPPPRTGATELAAFPPKATRPAKPAAAKGPLEVVRFAPEGDVALAPHLSVTFSQPMVPVTSLDTLAAKDVPVVLEPTPAGKWRWVGTRTLLFEPEGRFPMATRYRVSVAAGTKSAVGSTTPKPVSWTFTTPPPVVQTFHPPDGPTRLQPVFFAAFDQRIDRAAVLEKTTISAGRTKHAVRLATSEEVEADDVVRRLSAEHEDERWLAFVPVEPLPPATDVLVTFGVGTPSAEGPLRTSKAQDHALSTFGPLKIVEHRCGWSDECPPGAPLQIEFSNPIDIEKFSPSMLSFSPELPDVDVQVHGNRLWITGPTKGRTTYKVTLSARLPDAFGQRLGKDEVVRWRVDKAPSSLFAQGSGLVVLDPAAGPRFSVFSVNQSKLRVRLWKVEPDDWSAYLESVERLNRDRRDPSPPGRLVLDTTVTPRAGRDESVETAIDLSKVLSGGLGHVIVAVEPTRLPKEAWQIQRVFTWVQATRIGLQAHVDAESMLVWTTAMADGAPLDGVQVELAAARAVTDARGLTSLDLGSKTARMVVARKGDDVAFLPEGVWWWSGAGSWQKRTPRDMLRWHVFDDRHLYRPGEEVHLKGWIRSIGAGKGGDVAAPGVKQIDWMLQDSRGNEIDKGRLELNAFGAFDTKLALPDTMNLGSARLKLEARTAARDAPGREHWHAFEVQEFRRPEYEVTTRLSEGPHVVREHAVASVDAKYYAGGPLPDAELRWLVTSSRGHYQPPGHRDFVFGKHEPWWMFWRSHHGPDPAEQPRTETFATRTDAGGEHHLRMDFVSVEPHFATSVTAEATVQDVNRQAWSASSSTIVHPATRYVGLRTERAFVQAGQEIELDAIVVDIDGETHAGVPISIRAARVVWEQQRGEMVERERDAQSCEIESAAASVRCSFPVKKGGTWRIVATVSDPEGRGNRTEMTTWVMGGDLPAPRGVEQEQVLLIPDHERYEAGQTAEIAVSAPWPDARGLVTLRRSGLVEARTIELRGTSTTLKVPITEDMTPNLHVQVDLVGSAPRTSDDGKPDLDLPPRPAFASGSVVLEVPPLRRALAVDVKPALAALEPGGSTTVDVEVRDAAGAPVRDAEVALVVVDEAVLALTGYRLPDPLETFYRQRSADVRDHHLRAHLLLGKPEDVAEDAVTQTTAGFRSRTTAFGEAEAAGAPPPPAAMAEPAPEMAADKRGGGGEAAAPIALRSDFSALASFTPSVTTDASGRAVVPLELPDNLTRYRIMAVAVEGDRRFGSGESIVTARLPLMVRPSPPRFLNFGDELELPVVLQNQTDAAMTVDVAMRVANAELKAGAGWRVAVPANDRVEVRFPTRAGQAGTARFAVAGVAGRAVDAASFELPVWTPATTEAFATYGEIDEGAIAQPVQPPEGVFPQFGGLEITTSSTAVQALTDAMLYLVAYPFDCSEQIASRILAVAALRPVLEAFRAEGLPSSKALVEAMGRDIELLGRMQTDDGGFSFWGRGWPSQPFVTVHVTHALERAKQAGFGVPTTMLRRARGYLGDIERRIAPRTPPEIRRVIRAYALYVLELGGAPDAAKARMLVDEVELEAHSLEALAWVLPTLQADGAGKPYAERIRRHFDNRATETAAAAHFATRYEDGAHLLLHSDRRADALILEALIRTAPRHDLVPKIVRGLLGHRKAGRWSNTQENAFVLLALERYFRTYEKATPSFVARAWLGPAFAGEHVFRGRTTERHHIDVPMTWLQDGKGTRDLVLAKDGKGRLYYRVGMRYAPRDLKLPPLDAGFTVERSYEAVDDPADVRLRDDGTWAIKAGARVRVRVRMVAPTRRYHVALVDPVPAGLEPLNPVLATTGALPDDPQAQARSRGPWWWFRPWYEHQNMRDERVEAFTTLLWEGVHVYDYVARATTPGRFVVPPPKAEEMYHPETFGRGPGDVVIVE